VLFKNGLSLFESGGPDEICELASADLTGGDALVSTRMESLKQRIGLAKNSTWSAFPP